MCKVQSQSSEAERALICSLFLEAPPSDTNDNKLFKKYKERLRSVFSVVSENDFFDERNTEIYRAVKQLVEKNITPDFITISESISTNLRNYLLGLIEVLPAPINLQEYARIIKKHSLQRQADQLSAKRRILRVELDKASDDQKAKIRAEIDNLLQQEVEIYRQIRNLEEEQVIKRFTGQNISKPVLRCNGLFPEGHVCMLAGSAAAGKTYIALTFAVLYILETKKPALVWLSEDLNETEYRIDQMLNKVPLWYEHKDLIIENLYYVDEIPEPLITKDFGELSVNLRMYEKLKRYVNNFGFILLDPLSDFYGQEENNNTAARRFMNILKRLVYKTNKILLVTHHTNKIDIKIEQKDLETDNKVLITTLRRKVRGASAFIDAPRATLYVIDNIIAESQNKLQGRYLVAIKSNLRQQGVIKDEYGELGIWELPFAANEANIRVIRRG